MPLRLDRCLARLTLVATTLAATLAATSGVSAQTASATGDSALARFHAHPSALSTASLAQRWQLAPERFRASWDSALADDLRTLDELTEGVAADVVARERMRLRFRHAWGRVS